MDRAKPETVRGCLSKKFRAEPLSPFVPPSRKEPQIRRHGRLQPPFERGKDRFAHGTGLRPGLVAPEADHRPAGVLHECVPRLVACAFGVLTAVEFHDEARLAAGEIREIRTDRVLPDEFMAAKLAVLQFDPQAAFGEIVALAERPRTLGRAGLTAGAGWLCGLVQWKDPPHPRASRGPCAGP